MKEFNYTKYILTYPDSISSINQAIDANDIHSIETINVNISHLEFILSTKEFNDILTEEQKNEIKISIENGKNYINGKS